MNHSTNKQDEGHEQNEQFLNLFGNYSGLRRVIAFTIR